MSRKAERGTKRTCQNASCGARFYDLANDPIICPICDSKFVPVAAAAASDDVQRRTAARKIEKAPVAAPAEEVDAEAALADVDVDAAEEPIAGEDETFLETEEDEGGDVSGIIGGGPEGDEEP